MDIFKLIYEHDLRLDKLKERPANRENGGPERSIEDFMKPDPTYSKFYFTGTRMLEQSSFGLNQLEQYQNVLAKLDQALGDYSFWAGGKPHEKLSATIPLLAIGTPILASAEKRDKPDSIEELTIDPQSNIGQRKMALKEMLENGWLVIYKETAHHGFDLHIFARKNIYTHFFYPLQELTGRQKFRFFSVNGKRVNSERVFYFETWSLSRPPHGAEEVFPETVL